VHEEVELGVIIKQKCKNIPESQSLQYVGGYCLALDLTEVRLMVGIILKGSFVWLLSLLFFRF
jgi:2-keto-4-pentenoate hydratase/2-oxohepta-3-ene-1,7-dioic acid hydratase (catechol pathway)